MSAVARMPLVASSATLTELVSQLPATDRAELAWAPKRLADLLAPLLTAPVLAERIIEHAVDEYLDAGQRLATATLPLWSRTDTSAQLQSGIERDMNSVKTLAPPIAKAALRAAATVMSMGTLGLQLADKVDPALLKQAIASIDSDDAKEFRSFARAATLLLGVFEAVKLGSPIPGRAAALARRADESAKHFATVMASLPEPVRLPWYDQTAPKSEAVAFFADWNPDNHKWPTAPATAETIKEWELVKDGVDSARPHRKVFS